MRLRLRLSLVMGLLGLLTIASVSSIAWWRAASESRASIDAELRQRIAPFEVGFNRDGGPDFALAPAGEGAPPRQALDDVNAQGDTTQVRLLLDDGGARGFDAETTDAAWASLADDEIFLESVSEDGTPYRVLTLPVELRTDGDDGGDAMTAVGVQLWRDVSNEEAGLERLAVQLAVLSAIGVAAVAGASWLIGRWFTTPIDRLTTTAEHLAMLDDIPGRVEVTRTDEVGRLAHSYNRLMSALEIGREQQRRLVADASHELRTPLTSLLMRLEYLDQQELEPERQRELLRAALADAERLAVLVADLVDLAAAIRSAEEEARPTHLGDVIVEVADRVGASSLRSIDVDVDDTVATIRPTMVRRAVHNLLDNALKYGPEDGAVLIRSRDGRIEVLDDGPGIAADDASHVFDRFYRSPKARSRPGNGIGLAIVQQVAEDHGGTTWIGSEATGRSVVGFSIAVAAPVG